MTEYIDDEVFMATASASEQTLSSSTASAEGFTISDSAAKKVAEIISEEMENNGEATELHLRISIKGGGCSGFKYNFTLDNVIDEQNDFVFAKTLEKSDSAGFNHAHRLEQIKVIIDYLSFAYLNGGRLDFIESVEGEEFVLQNPNAKTTCGCGSSFSID